MMISEGVKVVIAFIQGELCEVGQDTIIVACQGIGYEIQVPVSWRSRCRIRAAELKYILILM